MCKFEGDDENLTPFRSCKPKDFCNNSNIISYEPVKTHKDYYVNFIDKFDLHCAPSIYIEILGSSLFIGWIFTLILLPRLSDIYGRKKFLSIGCVVFAGAFWMITFTTNYYVLVASITVVGMCCTLRSAIYNVFVYEVMTKDSY